MYFAFTSSDKMNSFLNFNNDTNEYGISVTSTMCFMLNQVNEKVIVYKNGELTDVIFEKIQKSSLTQNIILKLILRKFRYTFKNLGFC